MYLRPWILGCLGIALLYAFEVQAKTPGPDGCISRSISKLIQAGEEVDGQAMFAALFPDLQFHTPHHRFIWQLVFKRFVNRKIYPLLLDWPSTDNMKLESIHPLLTRRYSRELMFSKLIRQFRGALPKAGSFSKRDDQKKLQVVGGDHLEKSYATAPLYSLSNEISANHTSTTRPRGEAYGNRLLIVGDSIFVPIILYFDIAQHGRDATFWHEIAHVIEKTLSPDEFRILEWLYQKHGKDKRLQALLFYKRTYGETNMHEFFAEMISAAFSSRPFFDIHVRGSVLENNGFMEIAQFLRTILLRDHMGSSDYLVR
jgi:hypothetical protein